MANHVSAKKRIRSSAKKTMRNKITESQIKTYYKKALATTTVEEAEKVYKTAVAVLDRSVTKGRIHKNTASRRKSAITRHLNQLKASAAPAPAATPAV